MGMYLGVCKRAQTRKGHVGEQVEMDTCTQNVWPGYSGGYYTVEWGQIAKEVISPHNRFFRKIMIFKLTWPVCFTESSYRKAFLPRSHTQGRTVGIGFIMNRKGVSLQCSPHYHYNSYCVFYSWRFKDFLKIQSSSNIFISIHNIRVLKNPPS